MKKMFFLTGIAVVAATGCLYSQKAGSSLMVAHAEAAVPSHPYRNNISTRAMRDFISRYRDVNNENWHHGAGNWVAVFYRDSMQYRVIYNERGDLQCVMKYYEEPKMDRKIRAIVKSVYYDYKIAIIQELEYPNYSGHPSAYIVTVEGESDWKKVKVCNGEMEVMEEYKKAG